LYLNGTEVGKLSKGDLTVKNLAVVDVEYFWVIDSDLTKEKN
jgi:hypothetical protein